jgi:tripartite-type tricarboxylate transporter receptor subunit TctC
MCNALVTSDCTTALEGNMKLPHRRHFLHLAAGTIALPAVARVTWAQDYPTRPITLVVPFAAGGSFDVIARVITPRLSEILHQQVIVENVGAAAGIVGTSRVAHAVPDGYSLLLGTIGTHAYNPALYKKLPYNPAADFAPVGLLAEQPLVLIARKDFPPNTLPEFIAYAKANAAKLQYGSAGVGSTTHLACALLNAAAGINVTHVPYRGGGPAMADMIGGQIHYMCLNTPGALPQIQGGTVKAIALLARGRSPLMPELATADEQGLVDFEANAWSAIFLPKGTPAAIVSKLSLAVSEATDSKAVQDRIHELGATLVSADRRSPEYLQALVEREIAKWGPAIKAAGISAD